MQLHRFVQLVVLFFLMATGVHGQTPETALGDQLVHDYFAGQTKVLTDRTFKDIQTLDDWVERRGEYRRQLLEMLGLDPMPEKTDLKPVVTGTHQNGEIVVERLQFQSMPGLYVTANLYRPKEQDEALPVILYVCGHGRVKKNGISYGNKTHYQHHGAWFARNGYVCLTIDTIQLGELEGIHHGTYREKMWWWNNRGYTPAGVEAWNCMRALDYLETRKEVDAKRIGVTGRSGGGAYSWWIAAIDDRIQVAVPVAGITSLHNHVVDGCVEGHCDCMFMVNTYQWDYPMVAALVAPRPLLISNTDKDRIFPLDGVVDVHRKVKRIYDLFDASSKLGLQITEGPHKDTQELRVHAFRWFNRFLKNDETLIESVATPSFQIEQLRVFEDLPSDERVTTIHETFVPAIDPTSLPATRKALNEVTHQWEQSLKERCFRAWPSEPVEMDLQTTQTSEHDGVRVQLMEFTSQQPYRLELFVLNPADAKRETIDIRVLDSDGWAEHAPGLAHALPQRREAFSRLGILPNKQTWDRIKPTDSPVVIVIPRGVGATEWSRDERKRTQIRRRFMQLGQTVASMRIYDVRRAIQALRSHPPFTQSNFALSGSGDASVWALYSALFEPQISELSLGDLPTKNRDAPDILNVSRFVELPQVVLMATEKVDQIRLLGNSEQWQSILSNHPVGKTVRIE
ncbi:MAG: alpha/beta hydrolase family protein [Rubripirellula sp.]